MPGFDQPTGVARPYGENSPRRIHNDYLYPRIVTAPALDEAMAPARGYGGPGSLQRGWLYPMDVNAPVIQAAMSGIGGVDTGISRLLREGAADERDLEEATEAGAEYTVINTAVEQGVPKNILYGEGKQFQFNPSSLDINLEMVMTAPEDSIQSGGTGTTALFGSGTVRSKLLFDRTREVSAASAGRERSSSGFHIDPVFAQVGVQKDIWDCFRIIIGQVGEHGGQVLDQTRELEERIGNLNIEEIVSRSGSSVVRKSSGTDMFGKIFDLGVSGVQVWGKPVALFFNANLVVLGFVSGLSVVYAAFNANLVPTVASIDLALNIFSTTSRTGLEVATGTSGSDFAGVPPGVWGGSGASTPNAATRQTRYEWRVAQSRARGTSVGSGHKPMVI